MKQLILILAIFITILSCNDTNTVTTDDVCKDVTCSNNGECVVKDGKLAMCLCNERYHSEELNCIENTLECEITEHEEAGECVSNTKMVDCIDITPNNATSSNIQTEITWKDGIWTTASNCEFTCNEGFVKDDENCIANHAPTVDNVVIIGIPREGETLSLNYDFYDEDGDIEGDSIIVWSTPTLELQRGTSKTFVIPEGYIGEEIGAWVHPVDTDGIEGSEVAASNNMLKILSIYEESISLPSCNTENSKVQIIDELNDWSHINDTDKEIFCVKPGDYSTGTKITLTQSGTLDKPRYIILDNGNDIHPGKLEFNQLAKVAFLLQDTNYWIIDRMGYWESPTTINPILFKNSDNNIINRYFMHNVGNGIYIFPSSDNNTIQNCRIERDDISIFHDRAAIGLHNNSENNISIKNTKILNNEVYNFVDGFQTIRQDSHNTPNDNYEGTIIDNNNFYIDSTIYTDCNGNHDPEGECAYAENGIDLKVGSENPDNPIIVSNNKMWGFRKSDTTNSFIDDPGAVMPIHFNVNNTIIKNNISFDSTKGFSIGDPRKGSAMRNSSIENNIFINIKNIVIFIADSQNLTIKNNLFKEIGENSSYHWFAAYNNDNIKLIENLTISTNEKTARCNNESYTSLNNKYFNAIFDEIADINGSDIVYDVDPTINYLDLSFTTDKFTNNPKKIIIPRVIKP